MGKVERITKKVEKIQKKMEDLENKMECVYGRYGAGEITKTQSNKLIEKYVAQLSALKKQVRTLKRIRLRYTHHGKVSK